MPVVMARPKMQAMSAAANDVADTSVNGVAPVGQVLPSTRQSRATKAAICCRVTLSPGG